MIALDTNVIVRVVTGDDPDQVEIARKLFEHEPLWIAKTVSLEVEWVLRFSYGLDASAITGTFRKLLGHRKIFWEDRRAVTRAIRWCEEGMDFADALHLASSDRAERFATFDRKLHRTASRAGAVPEVDLLAAS